MSVLAVGDYLGVSLLRAFGMCQVCASSLIASCLISLCLCLCMCVSLFVFVFVFVCACFVCLIVFVCVLRVCFVFVFVCLSAYVTDFLFASKRFRFVRGQTIIIRFRMTIVRFQMTNRLCPNDRLFVSERLPMGGVWQCYETITKVAPD